MQTMTAKHTPGPWKMSHGGLPGDSGFSIASDSAEADNVKITAECWPCTIVSEDHRQELFANGRLIAAAPELLEALRYARRFVDPENCDVAFIDAAIAKARGE